MTVRQFAYKAFIVVLGFGTIGFALKFTTYFENWVWFPTWPNLGDSVFLIITAIVLLIVGLRSDKRGG